MIKKSNDTFENIISVENLLLAWYRFQIDKKNKKDVLEFKIHLMDNIFDLHNSLKNKSYIHGEYQHFTIEDPKHRDIHKATVRDRLVHHAIYRALYNYFDSKFIYDSYSCRKNKGMHKALIRFEEFSRKVSKNHTKQCWILKCDIKKFFASINHKILLEILNKYICDEDIIWLIEKVVESFYSTEYGNGLPLGNLTSQLLVNIYMNEFDQYVKHKLKAGYYIRYADDFIFVDTNKENLQKLLADVGHFLSEKLKLTLHPNKVFIKSYSSGVDFLGWVHFPKHRVLRTSTKNRMFRRLENDFRVEVINSYLGLLKWGNTYKISKSTALLKKR